MKKDLLGNGTTKYEVEWAWIDVVVGEPESVTSLIYVMANSKEEAEKRVYRRYAPGYNGVPVIKVIDVREVK